MTDPWRGDRRRALNLPLATSRRRATFTVLAESNGCETTRCRRAAGWLATFTDGSALRLCATHASELWEESQ